MLPGCLAACHPAILQACARQGAMICRSRLPHWKLYQSGRPCSWQAGRHAGLRTGSAADG